MFWGVFFRRLLPEREWRLREEVKGLAVAFGCLKRFTKVLQGDEANEDEEKWRAGTRRVRTFLPMKPAHICRLPPPPKDKLFHIFHLLPWPHFVPRLSTSCTALFPENLSFTPVCLACLCLAVQMFGSEAAAAAADVVRGKEDLKQSGGDLQCGLECWPSINLHQQRRICLTEMWLCFLFPHTCSVLWTLFPHTLLLWNLWALTDQLH